MKFMRPTLGEAKVLLSVTRGPGWADMNKVIKREVDRLYEVLVEAREPAVVYQTQGQLKAYLEILGLPGDLPEFIEKSGG